MTPEERKQLIDSKHSEIRKLHKEIHDLEKGCQHQLYPLKPKDLADEWMSVSSQCMICRLGFGWRCKKSPDGVCHYFTENGKVKLIDGTLVDHPPEHDSDYETDDCCIWCGMPEERK